MRCKFIKRIYQNEKNGYMVVKYRASDEATFQGKTVDEFIATGYHLPIESAKAVEVDLSGGWVKSKYGMQYQVDSFEESVDPTEKGITTYLLSCIKGVGPKLAQKVFDTFGLETLDVMDKEPERLLDIPGITMTKCDQIIESYRSSHKLRGLITFLAPHDISAARARSIYAKLGQRSLEIIKNEPYTLCKFSGIGFKTADEIARAIGFDPCSCTRIFEGINYVMREAQSNGHLYLTWDDTVEKALALLKNCKEAEILERTHIDHALNRMLGNDLLHCERTGKYGNLLYTAQAYTAEKETAIAVARLLAGEKDERFPDNLEPYIEAMEKRLGLFYSGEQKQALMAAFCNPFSIITGHPGTGKTTVLRGIIDLMTQFRPDARILLCSPTGRGARRMSEATGHDAFTIHSVLELPDNDNFANYEKKTLDSYDLIIVDEVSMLDIFLANVLLSSIQVDSKVVFVGDPDQIPSVGPGAVLAELIRSSVVPVTVLDTIFRQAETSRIIRNSASIREGCKKLDFGDDFQYIKAENDEDAVQKIEDEFMKAIANGVNLDDIEILTPRKDVVATGSENLNRILRDMVNGPSAEKREITAGSRSFREGDKVMQMKNRSDKGVNNGDIGYIEKIFGGDDPRAIIDFGSGRKAEYRPMDFRHIKWAYSMTVHKSQGNEYDTVILCLMKSHYGGGLLKRNLAYTGITRAKNRLIFVGQLQAMYMSIDNPDTERRNTLLADRIRSYLKRMMERRGITQNLKAS